MKVLTTEPLFTKNDVVFGQGGKTNTLRGGSLYNDLANDCWQMYTKIPPSQKENKDLLVMESIVNPIIESGGRFFSTVKGNNSKWALLDPNDEDDLGKIRTKVAQKFRDLKKAARVSGDFQKYVATTDRPSQAPPATKPSFKSKKETHSSDHEDESFGTFELGGFLPPALDKANNEGVNDPFAEWKDKELLENFFWSLAPMDENERASLAKEEMSAFDMSDLDGFDISIQLKEYEASSSSIFDDLDVDALLQKEHEMSVPSLNVIDILQGNLASSPTVFTI